MVFSRSTPDFNWQIYGKQAIDLMGALLAILLFSPILIGCTIDSSQLGGSCFFQAKAQRLNGKPFTMYKFPYYGHRCRAALDELMAYNEMAGPVFKVTDDPRITGVGKFLRRRSFDELPQLFNVLKR